LRLRRLDAQQMNALTNGGGYYAQSLERPARRAPEDK
jgi:hypothetical protein